VQELCVIRMLLLFKGIYSSGLRQFKAFLVLALLGISGTAQAGLFCSDFPQASTWTVDKPVHLVDGSDPLLVGLTQITIDTHCNFQNFVSPNDLDVTINFQTNDPSVYLITFDNVSFTGNMSCSNIPHKIWFVNGSDTGSNKSCQDLLIPVETIDKQNPPRTSVGIGEQFTYTLTLPSMQVPAGDPSPNELFNVVLGDVLTAAATGAELTMVSYSGTYVSVNVASTVAVGDPAPLVPATDPLATNLCGTHTNKNLCFDPFHMLPGEQIRLDITVVVDDVPGNTDGTVFVNTAKWWFGREIDIDEDGTITPEETFTPLPGESGVTPPMTISAPNLIVTKSSDTTAISLDIANFTIDVQNTGGGSAWYAVIEDILPDSTTPLAGTCPDPGIYDLVATVSAGIYAADGTTGAPGLLAAGSDYAITYDQATCRLTFEMLTATAVIEPTERLIIRYAVQLDDGPATQDAFDLTNVAGATHWESGDGSFATKTYTRTLTDGTPGVSDHQDAYTVTTALTGYFFQKTVVNLTSGDGPGIGLSAVPGDQLQYRLRVFNLSEAVNGVTITDIVDPAYFNLASFSMVSYTTGIGATYTWNAFTGELNIVPSGASLDLVPPTQLEVVFNINLRSDLSNGAVIPNQATLTANGGALVVTSDDPYDSLGNGIAAPGTPGDVTNVTIQTPLPATKTASVTSATIGEQYTYTIRIDAPADMPIYDVRIIDDLSATAGMSFVSASVVSGGAWTLTNTGTATSVVLEDTGVGIDIPGGGWIEILLTVQLSNTVVNQAGLSFVNSLYYTYNRANGDFATSTALPLSNSGAITVLEPNISTFSKIVDNSAPTAGEVIRYTVSLTAENTATSSDVFDVTLIDTLGLGLEYAGNPVVTGAGNTIGAPDINLDGDGITIPYVLQWGLNGNEVSDIDIPAGTTITISYDVRVLDSVLAGASLSNSAVAQWTGTDGINGAERNGSDGAGGVLNDYATAPAVVTVTTPNLNATITKVHSTDTFVGTDTDVRIGDLVDYTLTINIPEGTLGNVQLVDTLPQGLQFDSIVSINGITTDPYTPVAPFSHTNITAADIVATGDATTGATTVTWTLGNVSNTPNDSIADDFIIVYRARVLNNVFAVVDLTTSLNNQVSLSYDTAAGTTTVSDLDTTITALQPSLAVTKTASPAGGDTVIVAGEVVTYTVDILNSGTAPAYDIVLQDTIPAGLRTAGITPVTTTLGGVGVANLTPVYDPVSGLATWNFDTGVADAYTLAPGQTLSIQYSVQTDAAIAQGLVLTNAAQVTTYYSFDDDAIPSGTVVGSRQIYPATNIATSTVYTKSLPVKALMSAAQATIGDEVLYQITVPGTVSAGDLHDVQVTDVLDANLEFVSAVISGGGVGAVDTSTATQLNIAFSQIPAGQQAVIQLRARVRNVATAQQGVLINNTVSYTFAFSPGGTTQAPLASTDVVTVTVTEPNLAITKTVAAVTPAPVTGGDIMEYTISMNNSGSSTAFDVTIVDTLPAGLSFDMTFLPTATISGVPVFGFVSLPLGTPAGPLIWGLGRGDPSLDIPAGSTLVLTYRVLIDSAAEANSTYTNSVLVDFGSQNGASLNERTGAGCPAVTAPNDYCSGPATVDVTIDDTNSLVKSIIDDSYAPADANVRVGDTVTYRLALNFQEGFTGNVTVSDVLPAGLSFDGIVSINGDSTADYTAPLVGAGSNFSYTAIAAGSLPTPGQTGTLTFTIGDVTNNPLGDPSIDTLYIDYRARVLENTLAQVASTVLNNTATLQYVDGNGVTVVDPLRLQSSAALTVWQPVLTVPTKTDAVFTSTAGVNIATDVMQFTLESCNTTGLAPAYNVRITDSLDSELDETSISGLSVTINGAAASPAVDYLYTPPAVRGGSMIFDVIAPVNPAQCVTVSYNIGFHNDIPPNQLWYNTVVVNEYWSLPAQSGQTYAALGPTQFSMTNNTVINPPLKTMVSPVSGEATVGEEVVYHITVPGNVPNSALYDVVINDTLHAAYELLSVTDISANGFAMTDNSVGNNVSLSISQIPAGQQALIELRVRVANNASANAGTVIANIAGFTYAATPGGAAINVGTATAANLTLIEPSLALNKTVSNISNPGNPPNAGDILRYSVTLTAAGTGVGDNFSNAFDVSLDDNLSLGLAYQNGSSTVDGGNTITDPAVSGDGIATAQNLVWQLADATADIDVAEGSTVTVTYDVLVLDTVLANQSLSNSVSTQWTGLQGVDANERSGSGTPVENDYFSGPVVVTVVTPDPTTFIKTRLSDTWGAADTNVRVGDIVEYELRIGLQEGLNSALVVTDTLPLGLAFEGVVHINGDNAAPYSSVAPFSHSDISVVTAPGTVTFALGDVTNVGDNNAANDEFVIVYYARVLDNTLAQVNSLALNNNAQLDYTTATGAATLTASSSVTLLQPNLSVTKTAVTTGGDSIIDAGELVTYTVNVSNSGAAPAYDLVVQDVIPVGMRNGAATITMVSITIGGTPVANLNPVYDAATGLAIWNLDSGVADAYTIDAGQTLSLVYQAQADADLGAGLILDNAAVGTVYYSFDDEAVPVSGSVTGVRQDYGPTNTAVYSLTSPTVGALAKANPAVLSVSVGDTFSYRITVPVTPVPVALHDVRILDDLTASAADLSFVSVTKVSGSQPWTPVNTGTVTNLVIEDTTVGIDIPAGEQVVIDITVQVDDTATNVSGLLFSNTADYTYNQLSNDSATQQNGLPDTTADMTIVGPDNLTLEKSGPATMRVGVPSTFTLSVHNTGTAPAYDVTITDLLPNPVNGGTCDVAPTNVTAQLTLADGVTPVGAALVQNTDFSVGFAAGSPNCTFTVTLLSAAAAIPADNRLIVNYDVVLDSGTVNNITLTNIAGATEWFSGDTAGAGATGSIRTYTRVISDGTVGTLDHEDAHSILTESPIILFQKTVINTTTGLDPGASASPGDVLHYKITATNVSPVDLPDFSIVDDLDALNTPALFVPGSLNLFPVPVGADSSNTNPNGGVNGTGLVDVRNLSLSAAGGGNDVVVIEFEVTLASVINSGTLVQNQAFLQIQNLTPLPSDDPNINGADDPNTIGDEDTTQTLIVAAPLFQVEKVSDDITGSATQLLPGDTLRYTITVKNIGNEDAVNALIRDTIPGNTTYVAGTTTLNGVAVADPAAGVSALETGMLVNAPENTTAGYMRADATATMANVATISFDVTINAGVINGTIISNQGFVNADGAGTSGPIPQQPSDDPNTATLDDPTLDIVGDLPLVDAVKTVALVVDNIPLGSVGPGDVLRYTISVTNYGAQAATGVVLTDAVPANTTYFADSVFLNGLPVGQPDAGISPLIAGIPISSADLTPPLPAVGYLTPGATATVTFDVTVNAGTAAGTIISNQGFVSNNELPTEPTDADGLDSNGDQPTLIAVGSGQQLSISKSVSVVGGGAAIPGAQLEYVVRVTNVGTTDAYDVFLSDNLDNPIPGQMTYVAGSGTLNGLSTGVDATALPLISADYFGTYGVLPAGQIAELRFRVLLDSGLTIGQTITNVALVEWNGATQSASASVSIDVGAIPGVANLNGRVWHDADFDDSYGGSERSLAGWDVQIYLNGNLLDTVQTDANGVYQINGLAPTYLDAQHYELRFLAPGAAANTAKLGMASSIHSNDLQRIFNIITYPGTNQLDLNLPIDPNGVIYDSVVRVPIVGATVTMLDSTGTALPSSCFDDPAQQNQVTPADGFYKFDLNFSQGACVNGSDYRIQVTPPANGFTPGESVVIPAQSNGTTPPFSVPACLGSANDTIGATANYCEAYTSEYQPPVSVAAQTAGTNYYLNLTLDNTTPPGTSQLFNNHIPIDPELGQALTISKVANKLNISRGDLVPYVITVENTLPVALTGIIIYDNIPGGFKYIPGSARVNGQRIEPGINGRQLSWNIGTIAINSKYTIQLLLAAGGALTEGTYVNRAQVYSSLTATFVSEEATATVRVVPDPTMDCSDIVGKVFDDTNLNGAQDEGEAGLPGVRLVTARGLLVTTDAHGRFHLTCALVPNEQRGSNFILKLDDRSLPSGFRVTTENPRVERVTRGKLRSFNFGATIHRVVALDVGDGAFEEGSTEVRPQWQPRLGVLIEALRQGPSILRLTYLADVESPGLVDARLSALKRHIRDHWLKVNSYQLTIENEVFWRRGGPASGVD